MRPAGFGATFLRSLAAYLAFTVIFAPFCYFSDYVPNWHQLHGGDPPQFEATVAIAGLLLLSPICAAITAGLLLIFRRVQGLWPTTGRLRIEGKGKTLVVLLPAAFLLSILFGKWIRHASCCPYWQGALLVPGFGVSLLAFLLIHFWGGEQAREP